MYICPLYNAFLYLKFKEEFTRSFIIKMLVIIFVTDNPKMF